MRKYKKEKGFTLISLIIGIIIGMIIIGAVIIFINTNNNNFNQSDNQSNIVKNKEEDKSTSKSEKKLDVPYYGKIKIGNISIDMLSSEEEVENAGFKQAFTSNYYEDPDTDNEFFISYMNWTDSERTEVCLYNNIFKEYGMSGYTHISTNIELPKNITYESTIEDVIKAYGQPKSQYDIKNLEGLSYGEVEGFSGKIVNYFYQPDSNNMLQLDLYFGGNEQKLYMVQYIVQIEK